MLLKKQTVWLLTMLSLVVVLSVYYVTSEPKSTNDLAMVDKNGKNTSDKANSATSKKDGKNISTQVVGDQAFEAMRISRDDERSKLQEQLTNKLATTGLSAEDISKVKDEMNKLRDTAQQEQVLETLIKSHGYKDALVESDGTNINITVKSKEQSTAAANDIIKLVEQQIGNGPQVAVEFQK